MKSVFFTIFALFFAFASIANAQTITILEEFDYGSIMVLNNSSPRNFTISPTGNLNYNASHFAVISAGNRARFRITGGPPNSAFSVTVSATQLLQNGVGPQYMDIINPVVRPTTLATNGSGVDVFRIGTTIRTSGDGAQYTGDPLTGSVMVTVNF